MVDISSCKVGTGSTSPDVCQARRDEKEKGGQRAGADVDSNVDGGGETPASVVQRQEKSREGPT